MEPHTEAAAWAGLKTTLENKLTRWNVPYSVNHAAEFVEELRREGWRAPSPDRSARNESWKRPGRGRTEAAQRHIAACREAIRSAATNG